MITITCEQATDPNVLALWFFAIFFGGMLLLAIIVGIFTQ